MQIYNQSPNGSGEEVYFVVFATFSNEYEYPNMARRIQEPLLET